MPLKTVLAAGLALALGAGAASAQTAAPQTNGPQTTRNPVMGDPGTRTTAPASRAARARVRAAAIAKSDKQQPGTENGNQPDRAAAGGGAR